MGAHSQQTGAAAGRSPLISAADLHARLDDPTVKIFDVRGTWSTPARALPEDYAKGHIAGAAFLDWTRHFLAQGMPVGEAPIIDEDGAKRAFAALGINAGDLVVLYDASSHMQAGRIWLSMRHWGFTNVVVLDGGWKNWAALGLPTTTEAFEPAQGSFAPVLQAGLKMDIDAFLAEKDAACVIDARGVANYAGKADDPRTGHIPGSINVPFSALLDPDTGVFLPEDALRAVLDDKAPDWQVKPLIASCGSGYAATVLLLALAQINATGTLFDGSFAIWKQDPNRSIAQALS